MNIKARLPTPLYLACLAGEYLRRREELMSIARDKLAKPEQRRQAVRLARECNHAAIVKARNAQVTLNDMTSGRVEDHG